MGRTYTHSLLFTVGDYLAGGVTGAVTAAAVHGCIAPETDMVVAMVIGMAVGMVVHTGAVLVLAPVLGMWHVLVPHSIIGRYGGMLFAMRDSMQSRSLEWVLLIGAGFGVVVIAVMQLYNRILTKGSSSALGRE